MKYLTIVIIASVAILSHPNASWGEDTSGQSSVTRGATTAGESAFMSSPAGEQAREAVLGSRGWETEGRLVLAQVMWGEAGIRAEYARTEGHGNRRGRAVGCDDERAATECMPNRDWAAIAWASVKWWNHLRIHGHGMRFAPFLRAYSSAIKPRLMTAVREARARRQGDDRELRQIRRRRFLSSLRWDGSNLTTLRQTYGRRSPVELDREGWESIRAAVDAFEAGTLEDPCPAALHWDHVGARVSSGLQRVECSGDTLNAFYGFAE